MNVKELLKNLSDDIIADIFLLSGDIINRNVDRIIISCKEIPKDKRKENAALFLTTYGGSADDAYRLIKFLKKTYKKVIVYVFGYCKSAGTLVAIGADEIVISDFGELGPLDIQLSRADDYNYTSGLCYYQELDILRALAIQMFETQFTSLLDGSFGNITIKTAAEISSRLTVGILSPISSQVDPLQIGEVERSIQIAKEYGKKLNIGDEILDLFTMNYPSHRFVIDFDEAKKILKDKVRAPNDKELPLEKAMFNPIRIPRKENQISECIYSEYNENKAIGEKDEKPE